MPTYSLIAQDGQAYGPIDEAGLARWAQEGRITAQSVLQCHDTGQQMTPAQIPALAPVLGLSPAAVNQLMQPRGGAVPLGYAQPMGYSGAPNQLTSFSPAVTVILLFVTFGIFPWLHFQLMHGKMAKNRPDDPSAGKAIGFYFIPFFNIYWLFFTNLRLIDRINEQRRFSGLSEVKLSGMFIWSVILGFVPLVSLATLIMWPIYYASLQTAVNEVAARSGR